MKFTCDSKLNLMCGERCVFEGINAYVKPQNKDKIYLNVETFSSDSVTFSSTDGNAQFTLKAQGDDNLFSLHFDVKCSGDFSSFDKDEALGIDIENIPDSKRFIANHLGLFWCSTDFYTDFSDMPERTQAAICDTDEDYIFLQTTSDKQFKSVLKSSKNGGFSVFAYSHYPLNDCSLCALIVATDDDIYKFPEAVTEYGFKVLGKSDKLRKDRKYPEIFEYLGWCSWDAFHMDVSHENLLQKAKEFKDKNIPVRFFIIDDMWADVPGNSLKTMKECPLNSFEGDPDRFPNGLKAAISDLKNQYGLKIGMWHPTHGYWYGIKPDGDFAKENSDLLTYSTENQLIPSPEYQKSMKYYDTVHSFLKSCGTDFVKVDNQAFINRYYDELIPIGEAAENMHEAIENSILKNFDGNLINCMGMAIENYWNRKESIVNRASDDFLPEDRLWFIKHILQCSFNSYIQGAVYQSDWDMWWSCDEQSSKNAVLRALSGGPVYVSDKLNGSIKETIMPIVLSDGRIIRLNNPAMPTKDCFFSNPQTNGKIFKVFNKCENAGIVASFNLDKDENAVCGEITADDIYDMEIADSYMVDYLEKKVTLIEKGKGLNIKLKNYDDFKLHFIIPNDSECLPVGLIDKYMSPATFKKLNKNSCRVSEGGKFAFCGKCPNDLTADEKPINIQKIGDLYIAEIPSGKEILLKWS